MAPVSQPFGDVYADLTFSPNQRIGFHADARYNVYGLGLREANADIRLIYPRFMVAVGPRFNLQGNGEYLRAETSVNVLSNIDVRTLSAWDVLKGAGHREPGGYRLALQRLVHHGRVREPSRRRERAPHLMGTSARAGF
jgi:hypothetical protein